MQFRHGQPYPIGEHDGIILFLIEGFQSVQSRVSTKEARKAGKPSGRRGSTVGMQGRGENIQQGMGNLLHGVAKASDVPVQHHAEQPGDIEHLGIPIPIHQAGVDCQKDLIFGAFFSKLIHNRTLLMC